MMRIMMLVCWLAAPLLQLAAAEQQQQATTPAAPAPAPAASSSFQVLLPPWAAANRSADLVLNFSAADAAARQREASEPITFRSKPLAPVSSKKGYYYGNTAVVRFGGQFITAVRKIQFYLTPRTSVADYPLDAKDPSKKWISWWANKISLCTADAATLQPQACVDYDPRNWTDCMWNGGFETLGPEDPRLIIWPSKGLFVMFNSKPWSVNPGGVGAGSTKPQDTQCAGPWAQQPWLAPLATYTGAGSPGAPGSLSTSSLFLQQQQQQKNQQQPGSQQQPVDPWTSSGVIRLQYLPPELQQGSAGAAALATLTQQQQQLGTPLLHKQKNWNPFIHNDELYFSQSFLPHVVIKPNPDGTCNTVHLTDGAPFKSLPAKPRGNTQAVLLPAAVSGLARAVYVGVVHTEVERKYENYFYLMEAGPPFAISAVSAKPLPLVPGRHPRVPAWDHISFPMSLQLLEDTGQLMVGYGSGDQVPRVKFFPVPEALALFSNNGSSTGVVLSSTSTTSDSSPTSSSTGSSGSSSGGDAAAAPRQHQHHHHRPAAAGQTDGVGLSSKLAAKLAGLSPRGKAAAQAAVAAVEQAMGLQQTAAAG